MTERLTYLFSKHLHGALSPGERIEFFSLLLEPRLRDHFNQLVEAEWGKGEQLDMPVSQQAALLSKATTEMEAPVVSLPSKIRWKRWMIAASIVIMIGLGGYFGFIYKKTGDTSVTITKDITAPETNKATITLPGGQTIMLDTVADGTLIAGIARKTSNGQLVFEGEAAESGYITASNPRNSRAMHLTLPDHTEVWLNADTYLKYPTAYNKKDRTVTLAGEAYFEVEHNDKMPFLVKAGDQSIEDLGTIFNVKAYENEEAVQTTLLEGVVKINNAYTLKPGEQFSNNKITIANREEVLAWKDGSFYLADRKLGSVANELSRWYDIEVVFTNAADKDKILFGGEIGRYLTLQNMVTVLNQLKINCKLDGKKLIIE